MTPKTGRILQEDNNFLNIVDGKQTIHHESVAVAGIGEIANINGYHKVTVTSYGTGTAMINIQVSIDGDHWYQTCCFNNNENEGGCLDNINISGWKYLRCQVESVKDGSVTVVSNAVY